ncbi:sigma-70 family RNA polymerase sigma factor [Vibrio astriarenae]
MLIQPRYQQTPNHRSMTAQQLEQKVISDNARLVNSLLYQYRSVLDPATLEDLRQTALIALVLEFRKFDHVDNEYFKRSAVVRIRGAIIDELRRRDFLARDKRKLLNSVKKAEAKLQQKYGREVTSREVCADLKISEAMLHEAMEYSEVVDEFALDTTLSYCNDGDNQVLVSELTEHLESLPEQEQRVLYLIYVKSLTTKEVSLVLEINEIKVHRLKHHGLSLLRSRMEESHLCKK